MNQTVVLDYESGGREFESSPVRWSLHRHEEAIRTVTFSPDNRTLLTGAEDQTATLWNLKTGEESMTLAVHEADVSARSIA